MSDTGYGNVTAATFPIDGRGKKHPRMLQRVALDREDTHADVVIDFVPDRDESWPDLVEVSARASSIRVRLRLHRDELEVLAVALDSAVTGGEGELYFEPDAAARR